MIVEEDGGELVKLLPGGMAGCHRRRRVHVRHDDDAEPLLAGGLGHIDRHAVAAGDGMDDEHVARLRLHVVENDLPVV